MAKLIRHFENFFRAMHEPLQNNAEAFIWLSGLPHPLYNLVTHLACTHVAEKIDGMIQHMPENLPHTFWVHPENAAPGMVDVLKGRGYARIGGCPIMAWPVQPISAPFLDVRPVEDKAMFYRLFATTSGLDRHVAEGVSILHARAPADNYIVYWEGNPVGIGTLFIDGKAGVVSNVAVLPEYQRKGCGRALMETVMIHARERGLERLVLGSSDVAEKLYNDLGFKKLFDLEMYALPYPKK